MPEVVEAPGSRRPGVAEELDVHVRRLRRKIERDPDSPQCVLTVRCPGHRAGGTG